jgi:hypothetical protein
MHRDEAPSGLPPDQDPDKPLGVDDAEPEGEGEPRRGEDAMPGIPDGEPQTDG